MQCAGQQHSPYRVPMAEVRQRLGLVRWPVKILAEHEKSWHSLTICVRTGPVSLGKKYIACFKSIHKHYAMNIYEHEQFLKTWRKSAAAYKVREMQVSMLIILAIRTLEGIYYKWRHGMPHDIFSSNFAEGLRPHQTSYKFCETRIPHSGPHKSVCWQPLANPSAKAALFCRLLFLHSGTWGSTFPQSNFWWTSPFE